MAAQTADRRPLGALGRMSFVVAMHAALLFVLARSFGIVPPVIFDRGQVVQIDEPVEPVDPLPRVIDPVIDTPIVDLIPHDPVLIDDTPDDPPPRVTTGTRTGETSERRGSALPMPVIQNARPDPRRPLSRPAYSASYIRQGIEGFVDVEVYVLPDGRVGEARVLRSSGFEHMDEATLDEAKRRWRLVPATRDGTPFAQWYRLRVKFELED
jgi:periplasmic protein TonB